MPPSTPSLRDVVETALRHQGVTSGAALERIAQAAGHKIVATTLNHLRAGTYPSKPEPVTLSALAYLSGLSLREVQAAAGIEAVGPPFTKQVDTVDDIDLLTRPERDAVLGLLRAMVAARREARQATGTSSLGVETLHKMGEAVTHTADDDGPGEDSVQSM